MLYNKERLIALMDKFNLAGVVAATPENIFYLSGHASWTRTATATAALRSTWFFPVILRNRRPC